MIKNHCVHVVRFLKSYERKDGSFVEKMPGNAAEAKSMFNAMRHRPEPRTPPRPTKEEFASYFGRGDVDDTGSAACHDDIGTAINDDERDGMFDDDDDRVAMDVDETGNVDASHDECAEALILMMVSMGAVTSF